jgi:hypothetical protein
MTRKTLANTAIGLLVLLTMCAVFPQVASAQNGGGKPVAQGTVNCSISSGKLKLHPIPASHKTTAVTLKANAVPPDPCFGSPTLANGDKVTITGMSLTGQGTATGGDVCNLQEIKVTVTWISDPKIAPSKITYDGGTWAPNSPTGLPANGGKLVSVHKSFGGAPPNATINLNTQKFPPDPCAGQKDITVGVVGGSVALSS